MSELPGKDADLRAGLARRDPARDYPVHAADSPAARELVAGITRIPVEVGPAESAARRRPVLVAAAAVLVLGAVGIGAVGVGARTSGGDRPGTVAGGRTLDLVVPAGDLASSCAVPDAAALAARNPVAFEGTVAAVGPGRVTLDVRRWFNARPDGVTRVVLAVAAGGSTVAVDGVTFTAGRSYLVSAAAGTVLGCGLTGEATPELQSLFAAAFPTAPP